MTAFLKTGKKKKITLSIFASAECLIGGSGMKGETPQRHFRCKLEVEKRPFQYNTANAIYLNGLNPKKIFFFIYLSSLHGCGYAGVVFGRQGGLHPEVVTSQFLGSLTEKLTIKGILQVRIAVI